jgi:hypothetical protein
MRAGIDGCYALQSTAVLFVIYPATNRPGLSDAEVPGSARAHRASRNVSTPVAYPGPLTGLPPRRRSKGPLLKGIHQMCSK